MPIFCFIFFFEPFSQICSWLFSDFWIGFLSFVMFEVPLVFVESWDDVHVIMEGVLGACRFVVLHDRDAVAVADFFEGERGLLGDVEYVMA